MDGLASTIRKASLFVFLVSVAGCGDVPQADSGETGEPVLAGESQAATGVPVYELDPTWPNVPFPNEWIIGEVGGIHSDLHGNVWIIQRPWTVTGRELGAVTGISACCRPAPPVMQFSPAGDILQAWPELEEFDAPPGYATGQGFVVGSGGATLFRAATRPDGYGVWGEREHTVYVDHDDFVWVTLDEDHVIYKLTNDGQHVLTIGVFGERGDSNDPNRLGRPAGLAVDPERNELYVADGYDNKRVIVFDAETGEYRRHWGAYGNVPDDTPLGPYDPDAAPAQQFRGPVHGIGLSRDGHVYVADRQGNRIQEFTREGEFLQEGFVAPSTRGTGAAYSAVISHDPEERFIFVSDGETNVIWILRRSDMQVVGNFGSSTGRHPGQFLSPHSITIDPQGNIFVGESRGRRLQKFTFMGYQ